MCYGEYFMIGGWRNDAIDCIWATEKRTDKEYTIYSRHIKELLYLHDVLQNNDEKM